ncbi:hypothetical protein GAP31_099 [Cronobacter phage vB_CsaM_GAP31]|uniref:Uncharacterized protein n=1 Tax=Cronobacter phage vB_CsaM_GAP31 TaxID=1141135 RepID=K4F971_9CAUD|nr:hypothetical protein GAP31_099 [Cronobacter phage vB_CsaM_GAP31]AFC21280.1 hypothetical protein GAP31_099 [Cronobacter phage vB_CsaM_GAP31]
MTYSIYGRMSMDSASREGAWYCLKTKVPVDKTAEVMSHYRKTWRYVQRRLEC